MSGAAISPTEADRRAANRGYRPARAIRRARCDATVPPLRPPDARAEGRLDLDLPKLRLQRLLLLLSGRRPLLHDDSHNVRQCHASSSACEYILCIVGSWLPISMFILRRRRSLRGGRRRQHRRGGRPTGCLCRCDNSRTRGIRSRSLSVAIIPAFRLTTESMPRYFRTKPYRKRRWAVIESCYEHNPIHFGDAGRGRQR